MTGRKILLAVKLLGKEDEKCSVRYVSLRVNALVSEISIAGIASKKIYICKFSTQFNCFYCSTQSDES